jgi:hypothetical protein
MIGRTSRIVACVTASALLAACTSSKPTRFVTVTTTPTPPSTPTPTVTTPVVTPTPSPTVTHLTSLKGTCDTLLPDGSVFNAIDIDQLPGDDAFVVGKPDPAIGRLAYLNCRYGVTGTGDAAAPKIEIGISLYDTATQAAQRITATVDDYTAHGASTSPLDLDGTPATMLTGGVGDDYDVPTLVTSSGQRTVAVSVHDAVATGAQAAKDATSLAKLALAHTGG